MLVAAAGAVAGAGGTTTEPTEPAGSCESAASQPSEPGAEPEPTTAFVGEPVIEIDDGGSYSPAIEPAHFVDAIDHPYLPFAPGSRWVYEGGEDGDERIEIEVLDERRDIHGISATIVHDAGVRLIYEEHIACGDETIELVEFTPAR